MMRPPQYGAEPRAFFRMLDVRLQSIEVAVNTLIETTKGMIVLMQQFIETTKKNPDYSILQPLIDKYKDKLFN